MPGDKSYFLGTIRKTYGINGEVVIAFDNNPTEEELKELESVFIEIDGQRIPFFISEFKKVNIGSAITKLELVNTLDEAKGLVNRRIYADLPGLAPREKNEMDLSDLSGFTLFGIKEGEIGTIVEILIYPENPVMRIMKGGKEILIPINDDLIESINMEQRQIIMSIPEGLISLFE